MIEPALSDGDFEADLAAARRAGAWCLWWLGQSGYVVCAGGRLALIDPYLSDSLTKKYAGTETPHERISRRVVAPGELRGIEVITSSHNHTDHLDGETLKAVLGANPGARMLVAEANAGFAADRLGMAIDRLDALGVGSSWRVGDWTITAVAAAHAELSPAYVGYVFDFGGFTLYHSGDTVVFDGMAAGLRRFGVDVAILPINGKVGNMAGADAARLGHDIGAKVVIPCHYDLFGFNTADPAAAFAPACERLGQGYRVFRLGERFPLDGVGR